MSTGKSGWMRAALQYPCESCGAQPYAPCITTSGRTSHTPHAWRTAKASADGWVVWEEEAEAPEA